jgi:hypothetical protein
MLEEIYTYMHFRLADDATKHTLFHEPCGGHFKSTRPLQHYYISPTKDYFWRSAKEEAVRYYRKAQQRIQFRMPSDRIALTTWNCSHEESLPIRPTGYVAYSVSSMQSMEIKYTMICL